MVIYKGLSNSSLLELVFNDIQLFKVQTDKNQKILANCGDYLMSTGVRWVGGNTILPTSAVDSTV